MSKIASCTLDRSTLFNNCLKVFEFDHKGPSRSGQLHVIVMLYPGTDGSWGEHKLIMVSHEGSYSYDNVNDLDMLIDNESNSEWKQDLKDIQDKVYDILADND